MKIRLLPGNITAVAVRKFFCALSVPFLLVACSNENVEETRLPISLNEVMVALVNQAADPIWTAAWNNPQTEADWRELERLAYQIQLGGAMLKIPGTGPLDDAWTDNPQWQEYAEQLSQDGAAAVRSVRSRDITLMGNVGAGLVETCEACHRAFKPDLPTMDMFGELSPLPSVSL